MFLSLLGLLFFGVFCLLGSFVLFCVWILLLCCLFGCCLLLVGLVWCLFVFVVFLWCFLGFLFFVCIVCSRFVFCCCSSLGDFGVLWSLLLLLLVFGCFCFLFLVGSFLLGWLCCILCRCFCFLVLLCICRRCRLLFLGFGLFFVCCVFLLCILGILLFCILRIFFWILGRILRSFLLVLLFVRLLWLGLFLCGVSLCFCICFIYYFLFL